MRTLLLLLAALIVYGSLYPFDFSLASGREWTWQSFLAGWNSLGTRADAIGNILLFVPYGFVAGAIVHRALRPRASFWLILLLGLGVALGVQLFQVYLPTRDPALFDVSWNIIGMAGGYVAGRVFMPLAKFRWESTQIATFAVFVLALWVAAELIPFVPSLDVQSIKDSVKPLFRDPAIRPDRLLFHATGLLVAGRLLAELAPKRNSLVLTSLLGLSIWIGKIVVVSTALSVSLCLGTILGFVGWCLIRQKPDPGRNAIIFAAMLCTYTMMSLMPFDLRSTAGSFHWIPFSGLLEGSMRANLHGLIERMYIYSALLWLIYANGGRVLVAGGWIAGWVWLVEATQVWIDGRSGSITDPILVILLATVVHRLHDGTAAITRPYASPGRHRDSARRARSTS